jgi:hypothetical protein
MVVVDGQQRLITLSLIAIALYREAKHHSRDALSRSIESTFLKYIDYDTDASKSRLSFTDAQDNTTYSLLLSETELIEPIDESQSDILLSAFNQVRKFIRSDIKSDPFKRLGNWADFLTNRLYFATFVHPDSSSAYQVFEVINTRGKDLTTADLLKNYLLSQVPVDLQEETYQRWQKVAKAFHAEGSNAFVQYIRHVVTLESGHVLPKYLYAFLASRNDPNSISKAPPPPVKLLEKLEEHLALYLQMMNPVKAGAASAEEIKIFRALNDLNVIAVRPILLALHDLEDGLEGMNEILRLVVKRVVVGSLGTGNVERRLSEAAHKIAVTQDWRRPLDELKDLEPNKVDFTEQVRKRQYSTRILEFLARSLEERTMTPSSQGILEFISQHVEHNGFTEQDALFWAKSVGNTVLLPDELEHQERVRLEKLPLLRLNDSSNAESSWNAGQVESRGREQANELAEIWYSI